MINSNLGKAEVIFFVNIWAVWIITVVLVWLGSHIVQTHASVKLYTVF